MLAGKKRRPTIWLLTLLLGLTLSACSLPVDGNPQDVGPAEAVTPVIQGPPVVAINAPRTNTTYQAGTTVNILARVENAGPDLARVEVAINGERIGLVENPNPSGAPAFTITQMWPATTPGQYALTITAFRGNGSSNAPASVSLRVVDPANVTPTDTNASLNNTVVSPSSPTPAAPLNPTAPPAPPAQPQVTPSATATPPPTATATPSIPMGRTTAGVNVRSGPGLVFQPPIGSLPVNHAIELLATNPGGDWYQFRYGTGPAWVAAAFVETSGNLDLLGVEVGPPTPLPTTPPTATPPPAQVNLRVDNIAIVPHPLVCGQASEIQITLSNNGTQPSGQGGLIRVEALRDATGETLEQTSTAFGALNAGEQTTVSAFVTVSTFINELQRIRVTLDSDNRVAESNENDNVSAANTDYVLQPGACP